MGTENAVMAASLTPGRTMISNAACEPHVQDLCRFLVTLGASIDGIGSNVLHITGVEQLGGGAHSISPEHIEVGSFIGMAAVTGGDLTIEGIARDDLWPILPVFRRLGIEVELGDDWLRVPPGQKLVVQDDLGGAIPKVEDGPWPQFPADLTSIAVVVATQAQGTVLIFEKMFESRLFFVDKLVSMGARIILCDPHRVVITGPAPLYGQRMSSPDIRAGMAMVIAALCAEGTSTIGDAYQIDKGYERIDERLRALGARIERVESLRVRSPDADHAERRARRARGRRQRQRRDRAVGPRPPRRRAGARRAGSRSRSRSRPTAPTKRSPAAGAALGGAIAEHFQAGAGWALVPAAEALASAALEVDPEPRLRHERRLLRHPRRRCRDRRPVALPRRARAGRGDQPARPRRRGRRPAARARSDVQGGRRRARSGLPSRSHDDRGGIA